MKTIDYYSERDSRYLETVFVAQEDGYERRTRETYMDTRLRALIGNPSIPMGLEGMVKEQKILGLEFAQPRELSRT